MPHLISCALRTRASYPSSLRGNVVRAIDKSTCYWNIGKYWGLFILHRCQTLLSISFSKSTIKLFRIYHIANGDPIWPCFNQGSHFHTSRKGINLNSSIKYIQFWVDPIGSKISEREKKSRINMSFMEFLLFMRFTHTPDTYHQFHT